ncbi:MAG TPA: hypothetical protein VF557_03740 [Jatrophihabitans sp.]|uniref:hypothetical protein n=1 Tax=Jatrophihabitans sp. TaxID=1932789 RepID=UPI002EFA069F
MSDNAFDELCTRLNHVLEAEGSRLPTNYDRATGEWLLTRGDGEQFHLARNYDDEVIVSLLGLNDLELTAVRDSSAIVETVIAFVQGSRHRFAERGIRPEGDSRFGP